MGTSGNAGKGHGQVAYIIHVGQCMEAHGGRLEEHDKDRACVRLVLMVYVCLCIRVAKLGKVAGLRGRMGGGMLWLRRCRQ